MKPYTLPEQVFFACYFGTGLVLGIAAIALFYFGTDVALKRRWMPRFVILSGVLFGIFGTTFLVLKSHSLRSLGILVLLIPGISLLCYMHIKFIKFCDKCGSMLCNQTPFTSMRFCSKCGAELNPKPSAHDDLLD
jgi:hypothetical protein